MNLYVSQTSDILNSIMNKGMAPEGPPLEEEYFMPWDRETLFFGDMVVGNFSKP